MAEQPAATEKRSRSVTIAVTMTEYRALSLVADVRDMEVSAMLRTTSFEAAVAEGKRLFQHLRDISSKSGASTYARSGAA